jgi:Zn-dependent protease with chaperone function
MKLSLSILLMLAFEFVIAQANLPYHPLSPDSTAGLDEVKRKEVLWLAKIDQQQQGLLSQAYQQRYEYLSHGFATHYFLYGSALQPYLDTTLEAICQANPDIPKEDIFIIPTRGWSPNASSMGDGTILLNMGLLRRLENESQLAFVLCHEIAHFTLSHLENTLEQNSEQLNDKKWERSLKRSVRRGNYQEAMGLLKTVIYDQRKHDRTQEIQADLLGMSYLSRTNYDMAQALSCLELLRNIDNEKYQETTELKAIFHSQQYPFKDRWIEEESTMFGGNHLGSDIAPAFHKDSLLTHPACKERMDTIRQLYQARIDRKEGDVYIQDSAYFHQ